MFFFFVSHIQSINNKKGSFYDSFTFTRKKKYRPFTSTVAPAKTKIEESVLSFLVSHVGGFRK